eukprot:CAMPEP_0180200592 /NCGR_PEP_ID=MMETSP0987-20121128/6310_1 /TAXON_ID=697907 /ORGANISM="non described non described, Strain CCMP2293" /LENGTH=60 /DNA_ID=CAMNT_0022155725 /DNA_START=61 /DNA_END=239 /DNA_ORIENTATION=+
MAVPRGAPRWVRMTAALRHDPNDREDPDQVLDLEGLRQPLHPEVPHLDPFSPICEFPLRA